MSRQTFKTTDVLKLEVETNPTGLVNRVPNPTGELGAWGWITPFDDVLAGVDVGGQPWLRHTLGSPSINGVYTEPHPMTPGQYVAASFRAGASDLPADTSGGRLVAFIAFLDVTGTLDGVIGGFPAGLVKIVDKLLPQAARQGTPAPIVAPAGTHYVALGVALLATAPVGSGFMPAPAGSWLQFTEATVAVANTSAALGSGILPYIAPVPYVDVLGPTLQIGVERSELNLGVLTATIADSTLDPSQSTLIRPGRRIRLRALTGAGTWEPIFTGKVSNGKVSYSLTQREATKRARITLTATDDMPTLGRPRHEGVADIADLPYVLEGCGVPWNVNGSGNQVDPDDVEVVAVNDQATAMDQVVLTRDSNLGYAWIDRRGVLQVWDRDEISATPVAVLDESVYNADVAIDYDTDRCINSVKVIFLRRNASTGETEEITYGPYVDQASADEWGTHSADFKIQAAIEDETAIEALASAILAANAVPQVRVNEVTIPFPTAAAVATHARRDLYDLVNVVNDTAELDEADRVTSVKHAITTDKWLMTLGFSVDGGVATPTFVPSPSGGADGLTFGQLMQPVGHVEMFYGAKADISPGWLALDGTEFDGETYPRLEAHLGGTTLPDLTDRFPIGAGTKALGTTGGAVTHTHGTPNHTHTDNFAVAAHNVNSDEGPNTGTANRVTTGTHAMSGGVTSSGAGITGSPSEGLPPWRALWFIIRAV
ncbi:tail fiber protein [Nocardioides sp. 503]|uniref:tail fiber protein n=1 Tax=Nocardioides sp. 503 TaxID=2508326 RepID=UPI00106F25DE|nr:tail fiber protein [Nocardioides sp. 503]